MTRREAQVRATEGERERERRGKRQKRRVSGMDQEHKSGRNGRGIASAKLGSDLLQGCCWRGPIYSTAAGSDVRGQREEEAG